MSIGCLRQKPSVSTAHHAYHLLRLSAPEVHLYSLASVSRAVNKRVEGFQRVYIFAREPSWCWWKWSTLISLRQQTKPASRHLANSEQLVDIAP